MKLTIKHFKSDRRVDICDDFDNVIERMHYNDEQMDIGTVIRVNTYVRAFCDGWMKAKHSIGNCNADERMVDVEKQNERYRILPVADTMGG